MSAQREGGVPAGHRLLADDGGGERAASVAAALACASRRLLTFELLRGFAMAAAGGAALAAVLRVMGATSAQALGASFTVAIALCAAVVLLRRSNWSLTASARAIEHVRPASRNVVITAEELLDGRLSAPSWIRQRVLADSASVVDGLRGFEIRPIRAAAVVSLLAMAVWLAVVVPPGWDRARPGGAGEAQAPSPDAGIAGDLHVVAIVEPPSYVGGEPTRAENPARIEGLEGSRLVLDISGGKGEIDARFVDTRLKLDRAAGGATGAMTLRDSGFIAVEHGGAAPVRRLITLSVLPDRPPEVRIESPGRDLLVPATASGIDLTVVAADDFALRTLELRYTKVSGAGEQFEFVEGALPLEIRRSSPRAWSARGRIDLRALGLEPGDSIVYRAVARDARPGDAGLASSETFFVEVAGPGAAVLEGFALPPEEERYGLSQQMIVLKLERLRARERRLARRDLEQELFGLSAEQRTVRANFIFLMGGHVEDEEEEAEHSHEIQEGRLENTARREINAAVGHMTRAEQHMVAIDTSAALREARAAVEALQRAFGRHRYFLRTLSAPSRIDLNRRLTGDLSGAVAWRREAALAEADERTRGARALLGDLLRLRSAILDRQANGPSLTALAERALRIAPADPEWQQLAERLIALRDAGAAGRSQGELSSRLAEITRLVAARARQDATPMGPSQAPDGPLAGAWAEEIRQ